MDDALCGILAVDKPRGITSHDVVARVRRITGQRRIGHAGTLDPLATGVLLLCLGDATRVSADLMAGRKWYVARIAFGVSTDTDDADGAIVARASVPDLDRALPDALRLQLGAIQQLPPRYSAIKRDGVPAYRRARRGQSVQLAERPVTIDVLALLGSGLATFTLNPAGAGEPVSAPYVDILVACSTGTYVRSIARDLGAGIGCGAFMAALRRQASGGFTTRQCVTLERIQEAARAGSATLRELLYPLDAALAGIPAAVLCTQDARRAKVGASVRLERIVPADALRLYTPSGTLLGVAESEIAAPGTMAQQMSVWHPKRVLVREG
jgi:tRNA pseudouridine55 synthase